MEDYNNHGYTQQFLLLIVTIWVRGQTVNFYVGVNNTFMTRCETDQTLIVEMELKSQIIWLREHYQIFIMTAESHLLSPWSTCRWLTPWFVTWRLFKLTQVYFQTWVWLIREAPSSPSYRTWHSGKRVGGWTDRPGTWCRYVGHLRQC